MYQNLTYWLFLWKRILSSPKEKNWSVRFLYKNNEITNCIKIFDNILHPNNITVAIKKVLKNKLTYFSKHELIYQTSGIPHIFHQAPERKI